MVRIGSRSRLTAAVLAVVLASCRSGKAESSAPGGGDAPPAIPAETSDGGRDQVVLTPEQARVAGIAIGTVVERATSAAIQATATIEPTADRQARVGSRISGRVTALRARVGDRVSAGQPLAVVDSPELGRARADYVAALARATVARESADREKRLFEKNISAEREWREAEAQAVQARAERQAAENRLHALGVGDAELPAMDGDRHLGSTMAIRTPIAGVVVEAGATLGQMVEPQDVLFVVMDLRSVWLLVDVYEQDLPQVQRGQRATVRLKAVPDRAFSGVVEDVGAIVDAKSRTVKVRVVLENPQGQLRPGMFATVELEGTSGERRRGVYVPSAAVQRMGAEHVVFVARGENAFAPRRVEVVRDGGDFTEIAGGVDVGERVVTSGSFSLKSELQKDELGGEE